jgi:hypothetical protein
MPVQDFVVESAGGVVELEIEVSEELSATAVEASGREPVPLPSALSEIEIQVSGVHQDLGLAHGLDAAGRKYTVNRNSGVPIASLRIGQQLRVLATRLGHVRGIANPVR